MRSPYGSPIITLIVGGPNSPGARSAVFYVHKALLVEHSPVFRTMLTGARWSEAQNSKVHLPEDRVDDWRMLLRWLYHQSSTEQYEGSIDEPSLQWLKTHQPGLSDARLDRELQAFVKWRQGSRASNASETAEVQTTRLPDTSSRLMTGRAPPPMLGGLIRLYIMADKYDIVELRAQIVIRLRVIRRIARTIPSKQDVERLWDGVASVKDPLKMFILETYCNLPPPTLQRILVEDSLEDTVWTTQMTPARAQCTEPWDPMFLVDLILYAMQGSENQISDSVGVTDKVVT